jgi:uncharacterized protein (TIGR03382 family)
LALAELLRYAVTLFGATRYDLAALRHDGLAFAVTVFAAAIGLFVHELADTAELSGLLHVAAVGSTVALTWGFLLLLWHRRRRRDDPVREVSLP